MRCLRCNFEAKPVHGTCPRCGYTHANSSGDSFTTESRTSVFSGQFANSGSLAAAAQLIMQGLQRGDVLRQGRYRLIEQQVLPENQRSLGTAWLATDAQSPKSRVIIREVPLAEELPGNRSQVVHSIASRLTALSQYPSFPKVIDAFSEQNYCFIVTHYIEGESLATLLTREGGALPERMVAEFGRQLSEMLAVLALQQPPIVHGGISPETIIVSPDRRRVSLIHIPPCLRKKSRIVQRLQVIAPQNRYGEMRNLHRTNMLWQRSYITR